jgi:hypothetical protein
MLMPIKNQKLGKNLWDINAADATALPTSQPTQRIVRSHGSVGHRLTFQKRAITASMPIVTNGNAAPIANIPPSISFVLKAISLPLYAEMEPTAIDLSRWLLLSRVYTQNPGDE